MSRNSSLSAHSLQEQLLFSKKTFLETNKKNFEEVRSPQLLDTREKETRKEEENDEISKAGGATTSSHHAKYAYVTLIHGIDKTFRYRGYLYNVMIMKTALHSFGSEADFIVMIGFAKGGLEDIYKEDLDKLTSIGIKIVYLPRLLNPEEKEKVNFAEMALLKITPFSFTQYEKVQFFDGDIMPTANMDCFFELEQNTFNTGNASPLNSGWFLAIPNMNDYNVLKSKAVRRLNEKWSTEMGWGEEMPSWIRFRNDGKHPKHWNFNGASLDQGLFTHYFVINEGRVMLLDQRKANIYYGTGKEPVIHTSLQIPLKCCNGKLPVGMFAHFTGRSKPWLNDIRETKRKDTKLWGHFLDSLGLSVNSSNIHEMALKPPLGYFAANV